MSSTLLEVDADREGVTGLAGHKRLRFRTRRPTRPVFSRFNAWALIGWRTFVLDLVRRSSAERRVRPLIVEPFLVVK
jgi:hypothetical protein